MKLGVLRVQTPCSDEQTLVPVIVVLCHSRMAADKGSLYDSCQSNRSRNLLLGPRVDEAMPRGSQLA